MHEIHGLGCISGHAIDRSEQLVRVELRRAGRRDDECAVLGIQFAIRNTEGVAGENARMSGIDHRVVMQRMPGCVYELELALPEAEPLAILCWLYARGGNRQ